MNYITVAIALVTIPTSSDISLIFKNTASSSEHIVIDDQTEFQFLGSLSNGDKVFNYRRYFNGGLRASLRLVVIGVKHDLVGMYEINDWATHIDELCVYFDYPASTGNSICLESGRLPVQAWIDGALPTLFR
ncbi:hypothetical protein [Pseudoalteromonas ardens]|uniref:Uncharacterized protein n=1 Tax=Pseudoalteromonas rubra TaxID=43658 RepID=A0A0L0EU57_9GAMM|nr:hypothetical protein [Pseudoalteromonas sp. R96]KNC68012.1 hypothetical protein AC626_07260 [Pseudoalteromonas rubra]MDK1311446.1 hypothetical protein [Pseudoalteromonas sp. R96]